MDTRKTVLAAVLWAAVCGKRLRGFRCWQLMGVCLPCLLVQAVMASDDAATPALASTHTTALAVTEAVQLAVGWHPSIAEAVAALALQQEQVTVARAAYYPQLSGGFQSGYDSSHRDDRHSQAFVLSVSQLLYDFGKTASAVRAEESGVIRQQAAVLLALDQVARQTAEALVEMQRYQQLLQAVDQQLLALERIAELARERSRKGASTRSDAVQSESRLAGARAVQAQYQAQRERWRSRLSTLLGGRAVPMVSEGFPDWSHETCDLPMDEATATPTLLMAQAQLGEAEARLAHARAQSFPTVSLEPSATHYLHGGPDSAEDNRTQYGVYINVNMPLYQGGAMQAQRRAAAQGLYSAQAGLQSARLAVHQELLEAYSQVHSLRHNLRVLRQRQRLSEETRDLYRQQYLELGSRPLLDLLNAEQEIHQSRVEYRNTESDLRQLQLACLYSNGSLRRVFGLDGRVIQGIEVQP